MAKRIFLLIAVNLLVMTTITVILGLLGAAHWIPRGGLGGLAVFCLAWGFGGAFISLAISRIMAKMFMGVKVIPVDTADPTLRRLVEMVHGMAQNAGLKVMPEVGIYEAPEINAFATGPSRSRSLVAVSTGLLQNMDAAQVSGVLGHEVTHIANGDMVTMTLLQGVVNAFAMFLARILAFVISAAMRRDSDDRGGGWLQYIMVIVFQMVFMLLGSFIVCWFSRQREFRADAGGAHLAGNSSMISALQRLGALHEHQAAVAGHGQGYETYKIDDPHKGFMALLATHPPIAQRIARLQQAA